MKSSGVLKNINLTVAGKGTDSVVKKIALLCAAGHCGVEWRGVVWCRVSSAVQKSSLLRRVKQSGVEWSGWE